MYNRNDPRFRRRLDQLAQNLESANENAQANLFTFSEHYLKPCFTSVSENLRACQTTCFPTREERNKQQRARSRGRAELSFDFYDDWEEDEHDALLSWDNDEFDRLLGDDGAQGNAAQPGRQKSMNYGTRGDIRGTLPRRKSGILPYDGKPDPTVIPSQSYFGFLEKLPFKIGAKGLRYKPSAADLQERPGPSNRKPITEGEALLEEYEEFDRPYGRKAHGRKRSLTQGSGRTEDSLSSRGDIFPSDEEDAVPLDEEFNMVLERRTTNSATDDSSTGRKKSRSKIRDSQGNTPTPSSRSTSRSFRLGRNKSKQSMAPSITSDLDMREVGSLSNLKEEEQKAREEEDERAETQKLAVRMLAVEPETSAADPSSRPIPGQHDDEPMSPVSPNAVSPRSFEDQEDLPLFLQSAVTSLNAAADAPEHPSADEPT